MPPVTIHDKTFPTKAAVTEYARSLMAEVGVTTDLAKTHPDAYPFLMALAARHPRADEKLRGAVRMEINRTTSSCPGKPVYGAWLHYADGGRDDISLLKKCVSGKDTADKLGACMRQAIDDQVLSFRESDVEKKCAVCGATGTMLHVDHVVEFKTLKAEFLAGRNDVPVAFDSDPDCKTHQRFKAEDAAFEEAWSSFHRERAVLQYACHLCNTPALHSDVAPKKVKSSKPVKPMFRNRPQ